VAEPRVRKVGLLAVVRNGVCVWEGRVSMGVARLMEHFENLDPLWLSQPEPRYLDKWGPLWPN
jgi:hypothetical protein